MNLLENRSQHAPLRAFTSAIFACCLVIATCALGATFGVRLVKAQSTVQTTHAPAGWFMAGSKPAHYQTGVDKAMIENGQPSAFLKAAVPSPEGFGTLMQTINASEYAGKRLRLRAWVKSQNVGDWAGVWMRVDKDKTAVAFDNMENRPIKGTEAWRTCDVILDVPQDATSISFGILLSGAGEVWMNDVAFEEVGNDAPVTTAMPVQTPALPSRPANLKFTE